MTIQTSSTAVAQEVILAAQNVTKYYEGKAERVLVLDNITLELRAGELVDSPRTIDWFQKAGVILSLRRIRNPSAAHEERILRRASSG